MFITLIAIFLIGAFCGVIGTVLLGSTIENRTETRLGLEIELEVAELIRHQAQQQLEKSRR